MSCAILAHVKKDVCENRVAFFAWEKQQFPLKNKLVLNSQKINSQATEPSAQMVDTSRHNQDASLGDQELGEAAAVPLACSIDDPDCEACQ